MASWAVAAALAGPVQGDGPWESTFAAEASRDVPGDLPRTVLVVGADAELAGMALCKVLDTAQQRCAIEVLPPRFRRDTDAWIAAPMPGLVYVVRPVPESLGVTVSVFRGADHRLDWYTAEPHLQAVPRSDVEGLRWRLGRLEAAVAALQARPVVDPRQAEPEPTETEDPQREEAATVLLGQAVAAVDTLDAGTARELLHRLRRDFGSTIANVRADRLRAELSVVGREATEVSAEPWFVPPQPRDDPAAATLLVFFEVWCPYSQREVPRLQQVWEANRDRGLDVVALTRQTRGVQPQQVTAFVAEHGLSFAVGRDPRGAASKHYGVRGVPAAVLLVDGVVRWMGHPASVTDDLVARVLLRP